MAAAIAQERCPRDRLATPSGTGSGVLCVTVWSLTRGNPVTLLGVAGILAHRKWLPQRTLAARLYRGPGTSEHPRALPGVLSRAVAGRPGTDEKAMQLTRYVFLASNHEPKPRAIALPECGTTSPRPHPRELDETPELMTTRMSNSTARQYRAPRPSNAATGSPYRSHSRPTTSPG